MRWRQIGAGQVHFDNLILSSGLPDATALTSSQNPALAGGALTLTATVIATGGTPTGLVTFFDGTTSLGTGTLDTNGTTVLNTSALAASASPTPPRLRASASGMAKPAWSSSR